MNGIPQIDRGPGKTGQEDPVREKNGKELWVTGS